MGLFYSYEDVLSNPTDLNNEESELMMKEYEDNLNTNTRLGLGLSLRDQEYLKHSSLFSGHNQPAEGLFFHPILMYV